MEEKPNYYAIIPAEVRYDDRLCANAKLLFGEITCLTQKTGECWASNDYFCKLYNVADRTIKMWLQQLEEYEYISRSYSYKENSKEIAKRSIEINTTLGQKNNPPWCKNIHQPGEKKFTTPGEKNCPDNNINNINNININNKQKAADAAPTDSKAYKKLIGYIDNLNFKDVTIKDDLKNWYNSVAKGRVSVKQLHDKLDKICNETNNNEADIKTAIKNAYLNNWMAFYKPKQNIFNNTKDVSYLFPSQTVQYESIPINESVWNDEFDVPL